MKSPAVVSQQTISAGENWWSDYQYNKGFNDALAELGLTFSFMQSNADAINRRSADVNDSLFWLKRTLAIYQGYTSADRNYRIPVTETHSNGRDRTTSHGRNGYFPTHIWVDVGNTLTITAGGIPNDVTCNIGVDSKLNKIVGPENTKKLQANGNTVYQAVTSGLVLLNCADATKTMTHVDELLPLKITSGGTEKELFTFGLNTNADWNNIALSVPASGYSAFFDGRARYIVSNKKLQKSATTNILQTLRENLLSTINYDKLNGLDGTSYLHQPSRGLLYVTYEECCWANGGQGLTAIGFDNSIPSHGSWGEWHEFGHHSQMGWSWSGQTEVTVNLYSLQSCYLNLGNVDVSACHSSRGLKGFTWDQQAIGSFLRSGQSWNFSHEDEFRRATLFGSLMTSWPDLFQALSKAYREDWQAGANKSRLDSSQEKLDWFVMNTSRLTGYDLREYYTRWGLTWTSSADDAIAAMKLPSPLQTVTTYEATLLHSGDNKTEAPLKIAADNNRLNTAFVINHGDANMMDLVWVKNGTSSLKAIVVDSSHRRFDVVLRAKTSHGSCANHSFNSAVNCQSGTSTFLSVVYDPKDNQSLPPGHYTGKLALLARDWHVNDWTANVNINLSISK
ncbi:enhancin-like peptidase M60 family [Scandinavium goeteborgense]|uniref:Enhancin-like peptidase M60 family n=2 Tax=Scandinavium goeteborgense TaxID=1851514 RepID=A0A4R6EI75_SCAGO|nr:enhancin-like peptidase M60 family [Scandinavium goeteborgense]